MGGWNSTRWGGHARRCTVEEALSLRIADLRPYLARPTPQHLAWQWSEHGKPIASIGLALSALRRRPDAGAPSSEGLCEPQRHLMAHYTVSREGEQGESIKQCLSLIAVPMRFGGVRWWYTCPRCRTRRAVLYLPITAGGRRWACRTCYGLRYLTQRLPPIGRMDVRMRRVCTRLTDPPWAAWRDWPPPKPRGMHWATYERMAAAWVHASRQRERLFSAQVLRLLGRYPAREHAGKATPTSRHQRRGVPSSSGSAPGI